MNIQTVLAHTPKLPASPQVLPQLRRLLRDDDSDRSEIIDLLKLDSGLVAQVIRLSNSAYYGASEPCNHIQESVQRIGFNEVYRLVGALATAEIFSADLPLYQIDGKTLWQNSVLCGAMMRLLSAHIEQDADDAYTIGLLSNLGMVVLNHYYLECGIDGYNGIACAMTPVREQALLGFTHATLTAELLQQWNFAHETCEAVRYQFSPQEAPEQSKLAHLLALCQQAQTYQDDGSDLLAEKLATEHPILTEAGITLQEITDAALDAQNSFAWIRG